MSDFTSLKENLLKINALPGIGILVSRDWIPFIDRLSHLVHDDEILEAFLNRNKVYIFNELISAPTGISIKRKEHHQLIVLIVFVLDEFEFWKDELLWKKYLEFRYKAFSVLLKNDLDTVASEIFTNLQKILSDIKPSTSIYWRRINNQIKAYSKQISRKIRLVTDQKHFADAAMLNTLYQLYPDYEYNSTLQEDERKFFRVPFFKSILDILFTLVFTVFLYGINKMIAEGNEYKDLFNFFRKGNFSFVELVYGFSLIYVCFWIFKLMEYSSIRNIWKNVVKGIVILLAVGGIEWYIIDKYNKQEKQYFPQNAEQINDTINKDDTYVLVTRFTPVEKYSVFSSGNPEINACQLFYKKMLENKESADSLLKKQLHIDYSNYALDIKSEKDFKDIYTQIKYDFVINGDLIKLGDKEPCLLNSCYIVDDSLKQLLEKFNEGLNVKLASDPSIDNYLRYYAEPFNYYANVFYPNRNRIDPQLCFDVKPLNLSEFNFQNNFTTDISFISSMENSPTIAFNYIVMLETWSRLKNDNYKNASAIDSAISCINNIQLVLPDTTFSDKKHSNVELKIHLLTVEAFFINEKIKKLEYSPKNDTIMYLWFNKTNLIGEALELSAKHLNMSKKDIEYLMVSYWFVNYYLMVNYLEHKQRNEDVLNKLSIVVDHQLIFTVQANRTIIKMLDDLLDEQDYMEYEVGEASFFTSLYINMRYQIKKYLY
jgi:hypothetical protein